MTTTSRNNIILLQHSRLNGSGTNPRQLRRTILPSLPLNLRIQLTMNNRLVNRNGRRNNRHRNNNNHRSSRMNHSPKVNRDHPRTKGVHRRSGQINNISIHTRLPLRPRTPSRRPSRNSHRSTNKSNSNRTFRKVTRITAPRDSES